MLSGLLAVVWLALASPQDAAVSAAMAIPRSSAAKGSIYWSMPGGIRPACMGRSSARHATTPFTSIRTLRNAAGRMRHLSC